MNKRALLLALIFSTFTTGVCVAEPPAVSEDSEIKLPPGVLPLSEPGSGTVTGAVINAENAPFYKEIILPELYRQIRFHGAAIDAARSLRYEIKTDDNWNKGTTNLDAATKNLSPEGALDFNFPRNRGFIFGSPEALAVQWDTFVSANSKENKKGSGDEIKSAIDPSELAQRILWNSASAIWSHGFLDYHFRLLWLKQGKAFRNVRGNFARVYPWLIDPNFKLPQLFRERFTFYYPQPLNGLSWLTFRFQDSEDDLIWAYSPAIMKVRELTGSNRSDSLVTSAVSADDFLGWSSNPTFQKGKVVGKSVMLVPFPSIDSASLDATLKPCYKLNAPAGSADQGIWNFETPKFQNGADWLPIKGVFIPRSVFKLELSTKDPYSLYGREELFIDVETMLPIYKNVFDRAGRYWKTIIASWGFASTEDRSRRIMYPGFQIVLDVLNKKEFVMDYSRFRVCDSYPQDSDLSFFDPKRLTP